MNKITTTIVLAGLVAGAGAASASTVLAEFKLLDHPGGSLSDRDYGLRYDNLSFDFSDGFRGMTGQSTMSVEAGGDLMLRVIDHGGGDLDIEIFGMVFGGPADGSHQTTAYVTNTYTDVVAVDDGWVAYDLGAIGSIDFLDDSFYDEEMTARSSGSADGITFQFRANGHRIDGDDSSWVARGWLGGYQSGFTRDWLTGATQVEVPAPGAAVMGLAGLGLIARRRR
ncbi:MAG: hypothetical protein RIB32_02010 [Phycisphaerales bacterium]